MKGTKSSKQGISLIVLVITIIIMIILAAAVILSLSSSGIVSKARQAKSSNDIANAKELVEMAYAEWILDETDSFSEYAEQKLQDAGYNTRGEGALKVTESGEIVKIPEGFTASIYEGENTVEGGLVIYETNGHTLTSDTLESTTNRDNAQITYNQFVWVPVEGGWQGGEITLSDVEEGTTPPQDQLDSINTYGGFYIARYEAGKPTGSALTGGTTTSLDIDGTDKPVSIKGATVWNSIPWDSEWNWYATYGEQTNPGCALVASKAYEGSNSVTSSLMYGAQWDAALSFISKTNSTYATNSTGMGWYDQSELTTTGYYAVNNIYDMAGNVYEWTYEAYTDGDYGFRVTRGGSYYGAGNTDPASVRVNTDPDDTGNSYGFRVQLFLK